MAVATVQTSSRNQIVAQILNDNSFGTLLFELLTKDEQESDIRTQEYPFVRYLV